MVQRSGSGRAEVQLGEITELGACFLGWPEGICLELNTRMTPSKISGVLGVCEICWVAGPEEVFGAVTRSAYWEPCGVPTCRCQQGYDWEGERAKVR